MTPLGRDVLQLYIKYQLDKGYAWPSSTWVAREVDCSRRTVIRVTKNLKATGIIRAEAQFRGHRRVANHTRVNWEHDYWKACPVRGSGSIASEPLSSDIQAERNTDPLGYTVLQSSHSQSEIQIDGTPRSPEPTIDKAAPEKPKKPDLWSISILLTLIQQVFGWALQEREGRSILRTLHSRGFSKHEPMAVVRTIEYDLAHHDDYNGIGYDKVRTPGAVVHSCAKRLRPSQVVSVNSSSTRAALTTEISPLKEQVENKPVLPVKPAIPYNELKRRYQQLPTTVSDRMIDRAAAVKILCERGVDSEAWFEWAWKNRPIPFPLTPEEMEVGVRKYLQAHAAQST